MIKRLRPLLPLLFACSIATPGSGWAQGIAYSLSVTQLGGYLLCPDTVYPGQATIQVFLQNVGADTLLNDSVFVTWMNADTSVSVWKEDIATAFIQQLSPGAGTVLTSTVQYDSARYVSGSNIVVVWPRVGNTSANTADSLTLNVCFDQSLTLVVPVTPESEHVDLIPNPADDRFVIQLRRPELLEHVSIYNTVGAVCLRRTGAGPVDIAALASGLYVAELRLTNREVVRRKLFKR
jgi:hypothetical protein